MKTIEDFRAKSDEEWLDILIESVRKETIDGLTFPRFPEEGIQQQFVGSSNENALREAFAFYSFTKSYAAALGRPIGKETRALDFGCGWGRFLRFLWKDVDTANLFGVDVDPDILAKCREQGVPGNLERIQASGKLPLPDDSVDLVLSYSVFTHLPEEQHLHWMKEIKRVSRGGCVFAFTIEPRRFLEFVGSLGKKPAESEWHAGLRKFAPKIPEMLADYDAGKFVFLPTGGGDYRDPTVYGDAIVPRSYLEKVAAPEYKVWGHVDDPAQFWQAAVVMQHR